MKICQAHVIIIITCYLELDHNLHKVTAGYPTSNLLTSSSVEFTSTVAGDEAKQHGGSQANMDDALSSITRMTSGSAKHWRMGTYYQLVRANAHALATLQQML